MATRLAVSLVMMKDWLRSRIENERGQDLIEYALLGGMIAAGILLATALLTGALTSMLQGIGNCIDWDGSTDCL